MELPITSLTAAVAGLLLIVLTVLAGSRRARTGILIGHGDDDTLLRRVRTHGNFTEQVPIALILMALVETGGGSSIYLWIIGGMLIAGRLLHILGILGSNIPARGLGMLLTLGSTLFSSVLLLI